MPERRQAGKDQSWWAITAIHEAAHAISAFALHCHPVELNLNRRVRPGDGAAGDCVARYEKSWYGDFAKIFTQNAPFVAHQYEPLPCGEKGDLHERQDAFRKFGELVGAVNEQMFRQYVDGPTLQFFGNADIQAATLVLANRLYAKNKLSLKQVNYWTKELEIPDAPCTALEDAVTVLAQAVADAS